MSKSTINFWLEVTLTFLMIGTSHTLKSVRTVLEFMSASDWEKVVREARLLKPFNVISMDSSKILNFSEIPHQFTHRKKDSAKNPVLISKALWMNFGKGMDSSGRMKKHPMNFGLDIRMTRRSPGAK